MSDEANTNAGTDAVKLAEEKRLKEEAKRLAAEKKAKEAEERKAQKAQEKAAKEEARKLAAEQKAKEKEQAKLEAEKAKESSKMPMQNGVRRPKAEGLCGQAWAVFDEVSAKRGEPASIGESMEISRARGLNDANVRAEYARWRKFNGVEGRVADPRKVKPVEPTPPPTPAA
jgi:membrane protein involved in colicin uptake